MQQYVAFDVSKQRSEAVIVDETGKCLVRRKLQTDPVVMARFVEKHGEDVALVGFEAGPLSTWLYHELTAAGLPVVGMDSWRARAARAARVNKTDRTDALGRGPHAASCVGWGACGSVAGRLSSRRAREELRGA